MSTRDPILAITKWTEGNRHMRLVVTGGLHYLRGNSAPYFCIGGDEQVRGIGNTWHTQSCGCLHELIERKFPGKFADLIALHLADISGVPMHFVENGWYYLAGALGGAGERYHFGNSERHFPVTPPADKPWQNTVYRHPTTAECLQIFADHCRITLAAAQAIADDVRCAFGPESEAVYETPHNASDYARGKAVWQKHAAAMTERFKAEAAACIAKHWLLVYGDEWQGAA